MVFGKEEMVMKIRKRITALAALMAAITVTGCSDGDLTQNSSESVVQDDAVSETDNTGESEIMDMTVYDLSGKEVRFGDMISQNKVTMLNFWGTFCGPCIQEMPGLGKLERRYKFRGFEILGMTSDIIGSDGKIQKSLVQDAKDIVADTGVEYPVLITSRELFEYGRFYAFPTTYFVDSKGRMLTEPVIGSQSEEDWEALITELIEKTE